MLGVDKISEVVFDANKFTTARRSVILSAVNCIKFVAPN